VLDEHLFRAAADEGAKESEIVRDGDPLDRAGAERVGLAERRRLG